MTSKYKKARSGDKWRIANAKAGNRQLARENWKWVEVEDNNQVVRSGKTLKEITHNV